MTKTSYRSLRNELYKGFFEGKEYLGALSSLARDIRKKSKQADNEATVVAQVEIIIHDFLRDVFNIDVTPIREMVTPTRSKVRGRIDSKIGAVIFEYKHFSKLGNTNQQEDAIKQVEGYLTGLTSEISDSAKYIGVVTDGIVCSIVEMTSSGFEHSPFLELNSKHLDVIIRYIILSQKAALTSNNLIKDLCDNDEESISSLLTHALYKAFKTQKVEKSEMLITEWKQLFSLAHDDISKQTAIAKRRAALGRIIGRDLTEANEEYLVLFSLQTSYAIIIKIIAFKIVSKLRLSHIVKFSDYTHYDDNALSETMRQLENGSIFREYGIGNLLEGDFFSWYCTPSQWTNEVADCIRKIFQILSVYEDKPIFESGDNVIDLFKELFMNIIPDEVRHSLGEYYTPMWLADNVISEAINKLPENAKDNWKGLDPCAGSGTFVVTMIRHVLSQTTKLSPKIRLRQVLDRVKGVDLNPLAVLSTRINYFINIAPLISDEEYIEIPIYLGDSSYIPQEVVVDNNIKALQYTINTTKGALEIFLPASIVRDVEAFSITMTEIESYIQLQDADEVADRLCRLLPDRENDIRTVEMIRKFANVLVDFERKQWNGIWARIVANYLTTACLGKFDIIVGNPPWVDWKTLPNNYRDRVKGLCIDNNLFSGDGITGGINLNICALITNVVANRYLTNHGILAFLMPQTILFQSSYEGFRNCYLADGGRLYIQNITDWTKSGHPFAPVQEKFLTYFFSRTKQDYTKGIPVHFYVKKRSERSVISKYSSMRTFAAIADKFDCFTGVIGQVNANNTSFTYANNAKTLSLFRLIAGTTNYKGREGVEFYPQELFLLRHRADLPQPKKGLFVFENYQNSSSKYKIPLRHIALEETYLKPLIKGVDLSRFHCETGEWVVPFPYDKEHCKLPLRLDELKKKSPKLAIYFMENKSIIDAQTNYNERIIGNAEGREFYALARVGEYSLGNVFVAFRDNTKWGACVIGAVMSPWGTMLTPCFQNHAVSISQYGDDRYITEDEAHYLCAILNAPIVEAYIIASSDSRSFKVRPPVYIPEYNEANSHHRKLVKLSQEAHIHYNDSTINEILNEINSHYIAICNERDLES